MAEGLLEQGVPWSEPFRRHGKKKRRLRRLDSEEIGDAAVAGMPENVLGSQGGGSLHKPARVSSSSTGSPLFKLVQECCSALGTLLASGFVLHV